MSERDDLGKMRRNLAAELERRGILPGDPPARFLAGYPLARIAPRKVSPIGRKPRTIFRGKAL